MPIECRGRGLVAALALLCAAQMLMLYSGGSNSRAPVRQLRQVTTPRPGGVATVMHESVTPSFKLPAGHNLVLNAGGGDQGDAAPDP